MSDTPEQSKRRVQQQFGATAAGYVTSTVHSEGADLEQVSAILRTLPRRQRALDIATGGGHTARTIAPFCQTVIFADITEPMLHAARRALQQAKRPNVRPTLTDAEALAFADGSFDLATCRIAPHHFPNPAAFIAEVARVVRPGGHFLLIESIVPSDPTAARWLNGIDKTRDPSHVRTLAATEWFDLLSDNRFTIREHHTYPKRHLLAPWLERANATAAQRTAVHHAFHEAGPAIRAAFKLEFDSDGTPLSFTDEKVLVWAVRKPGSA